MKICDCSNKKNKKNKEKRAYGLIDHIVNKLPEIHIPGYQYCGPGTDLKKRLERGDRGINKLDEACKDHDLAYQAGSNSKNRREADKVLIARAFKRVYAKDSNLSERAAALLVSSLIGAKVGLSKIGLGFDSNNNNNNSSTCKNMKRGKTVRRRRRARKTRRVKRRQSVRFGGAIRRRRRTRRGRRTRVLRVPSRFMSRIGGSGLYLRPYHR